MTPLVTDVGTGEQGQAFETVGEERLLAGEGPQVPYRRASRPRPDASPEAPDVGDHAHGVL